MLKQHRSRRTFRLTTACLLLAAAPAAASDFWWRGDLSNNWGSNTAVVGIVVNTNFATTSDGLNEKFALPGSGDVVRFASSNAGNLNTVLGSNVSISGLTTETSLGGNVVIGGNTLNLDFTSTGIVTNAPRTLTINSTLTSNTISLVINTANALSVVNLNSSFDGTASVTKRGPGTLNLNSPNTYSGATVVTGGTLNANAANALSAGKILTIGQSSTLNTATVHTGGFAQSIAGLTLFARDSSNFVAVDVGSGTLTLTGNVALVDTQDFPGNLFGATIAAAPGGTLNLGGGVRNFTAAGQRFFQQEIVINAVVANGGINLTANPSSVDGSAAGMLLNATSPNTFTGGTTVNAGVLTVSFSTTLGPGALVLKTAGNVDSGVLLYNATQTLTSLQTGTLGTGAAGLFLDGTALTVNQSTNTTFAGSISGTGSLGKSGIGDLVLGRANTFTGGTVVTAGTLTAAAANALPIGKPITIGQASAATNATMDTGGFAQSISTLTLFARSNTTPIAVDIGSGTLTISGNVSLLDTQDNPGNKFGATIASTPGGTLNLGGGVRNFTLAGQNVGVQELVINPVITNGGINLSANPSSTILNPAGMILNAASANTYAGGTTVNAGFLTVNASTTLGPGALTLKTTGSVESRVVLNNAAQTVSSLQTGTLGTGAATLVLNGTALTVNQSFDTTFAGNVSGSGSITKSNLGTLTLGGAVSYIGNTVVTGGGKLVLSSALNTATGDVLLSTIGKIDFARARTISPVIVSTFDNLTVPSGSVARVTRSTRTGGLEQGVLIVNTLSISGSGFVDLTNNDMIVRGQTVASVRGLAGAWYTADAGLPGTRGLGSSESFYTVVGAFTTLAVYDNSIAGQTLATFEGIPVLPTDVLVKYTYLGDTNIDGVVDASDLSRVLQGMNGLGSGWNFGDVNYDGVVNFVDLGRTQAALRGQGAPLGGSELGGGGVIPEPASLGLVLAAVPLMGRRRK